VNNDTPVRGKNSPTFQSSPITTTVEPDPTYYYDMTFTNRKTGEKTVIKDLKAAGYIDAAHPYLRVIDSEMLHYGPLFDGSQRVYCVVKVYVRITIDGKTVEASALSDGSSGDNDIEALVRSVETRGLKRAIARALNLDAKKFNSGAVEAEEESGTPIRFEMPLFDKRSGSTITPPEKPPAARKPKVAEGEDGW